MFDLLLIGPTGGTSLNVAIRFGNLGMVVTVTTVLILQSSSRSEVRRSGSNHSDCIDLSSWRRPPAASAWPATTARVCVICP